MNYWMVQANPGGRFILHYWLDDYVKRQTKFVEVWWQTTKKYNPEYNVKLGDMVFFWKAKSEPTKEDAPDYYKYERYSVLSQRPPGIYAVGVVTDTEEYKTAWEVDGGKCSEAKYYAKPKGKNGEDGVALFYKSYKEDRRCWILIKIRDYRDNLVDNPLPQDKLMDHPFTPKKIYPGLELLWKKMKVRQGKSIFPEVDEKEANILLKLIHESTGTRILK